MTCKEAEAMITSYMDETLEISDLRSFVSHIDDCPDCRDELEVRFLVYKGLQMLEAGESFDLKHELDVKLARSRSVIAIAYRVRVALVITGIMLSLILAGVVLGIFVF